MRGLRAGRAALHAAMAACALAACGGGGPTVTDETARVTGTVRNGSTDEALAGATVTAGSAEATSDANGRFDLDSVPVDPSVTIRSARAGFATYTENIDVQAGDNIHDIRMTRQALYEMADIAVYVPPDVSTVRGVILALGGQDTRPLATGVFNNPDEGFNESQRQTRQGFLVLASAHGLAVMGSVPLSDGPASDTRVLAALDAVAVASDRLELAQAPLLIRGISAGARETFGFTVRRPDRVIGFALIIPPEPSTVTSPAARDVPGYVLLAELDQIVDNNALTAFFAANRREGAIWSFAVEPGATHETTSSRARALMVDWMNTIFGLRLPPTVAPGVPVVLRSIDEASGWLGHRTSFAIAPYADYADDRLDASWLPSQGTAQTWHGFVTTPPTD